jgi:DNA mismatch repair ATPase MutL
MLVHLGRLYQRVLYDACIKRLLGETLGFSMQKLMFPVEISLPAIAIHDFSAFQKIFHPLGIAISRRGEELGEVDAIASHIKEENLLSLIEEGIDVIEKYGSVQMLSTEAKEEIAILFVKNSRSKEISLNEANQLLGQYLREKSGHYSPFGEPIFALLGDDELKEVLRSYQKNPSEDGECPSRSDLD